MTHYKENVWAGIYSIYLSNDSGKTWIKRSPDFQSKEFVQDIRCFDKNTVIVILSIYEGYYFSSRLLITYDEGLSWREIYSGGYRLTSATFLRSRDQILATRMRLPGDAHLIRTFDGGTTWIIDPTDGGTLDVKVRDNGDIFLLNSYPDGWCATVRKSTDNGQTWTQFQGNLHYDCYSLELDKCDPNGVFVVDEEIWAGGYPPTMYYSSDAGTTFWDARYHYTFPKLSGSLTTSRSAVFAQTLDSGIVRSTDKYLSWKVIGGPNGLPDSRLLIALNNNTLISIGDDGSIWRTVNCGGYPIPNDEELYARLKDITIDTIGQNAVMEVYFQGSALPIDAEMTFHPDSALSYLGCYAYDGTLLTATADTDPRNFKITIPSQFMRSGSPSCYLIFTYPSPRETPYLVTVTNLNYPGKLSQCSFLEDEPAYGIITPLTGCGIDILGRFLTFGEMPQLTVYPNPAKEMIVIHSTKRMIDVQLTIFSVMGQKLLQKNITIGNNSDSEISVASLSEGSYLIVLSSASFKTSLPLIIKR
jgi:photosystem II stability/assembly factor-like uncharacterized protein